ncbi:hypothetical protein [Arsenicicoccus bolidensis]|uniref:hypothetical protein n=1 Tax=Arsenicicoccus bolidensis TaxID=229480 RepID=UPI0028AD701E|nr:hypothetical protein [Arsenicicoccus bolidensis]
MTGRTPAPAPEPAAGAGARARSLGSRLGEGLVMTVTFLIFRLVMIWLGLFDGEPFLATASAALLFGVFWVLVGLAWDVWRRRRQGERR